MAFSTIQGKAFRKFFTGAHFGELALFRNALRTETAITEHNCELYIMPKSDFYDIMEAFP